MMRVETHPETHSTHLSIGTRVDKHCFKQSLEIPFVMCSSELPKLNSYNSPLLFCVSRVFLANHSVLFLGMLLALETFFISIVPLALYFFAFMSLTLVSTTMNIKAKIILSLVSGEFAKAFEPDKGVRSINFVDSNSLLILKF